MNVQQFVNNIELLFNVSFAEDNVSKLPEMSVKELLKREFVPDISYFLRFNTSKQSIKTVKFFYTIQSVGSIFKISSLGKILSVQSNDERIKSLFTDKTVYQLMDDVSIHSDCKSLQQVFASECCEMESSEHWNERIKSGESTKISNDAIILDVTFKYFEALFQELDILLPFARTFHACKRHQKLLIGVFIIGIITAFILFLRAAMFLLAIDKTQLVSVSGAPGSAAVHLGKNDDVSSNFTADQVSKCYDASLAYSL